MEGCFLDMVEDESIIDRSVVMALLKPSGHSW